MFQRSIVHLDTLKLERNLYNEVLNKRNAWYALEDRRTVLEIGKPVFADIWTGEEIRMDVWSMDVTSTIIE